MTAGAVLGFLFYNFNPARIFMGDSGSYFLGYVLATTGAHRRGDEGLHGGVAARPRHGAGRAHLRHALRHGAPHPRAAQSVFSPDRGHIHHRLLDMGLTHRRAVIIIYAVCGVFTVAAIGVSLERALAGRRGAPRRQRGTHDRPGALRRLLRVPAPAPAAERPLPLARGRAAPLRPPRAASRFEDAPAEAELFRRAVALRRHAPSSASSRCSTPRGGSSAACSAGPGFHREGPTVRDMLDGAATPSARTARRARRCASAGTATSATSLRSPTSSSRSRPTCSPRTSPASAAPSRRRRRRRRSRSASRSRCSSPLRMAPGVRRVARDRNRRG